MDQLANVAANRSLVQNPVSNQPGSSATGQIGIGNTSTLSQTAFAEFLALQISSQNALAANTLGSSSSALSASPTLNPLSNLSGSSSLESLLSALDPSSQNLNGSSSNTSTSLLAATLSGIGIPVPAMNGIPSGDIMQAPTIPATTGNVSDTTTAFSSVPSSNMGTSTGTPNTVDQWINQLSNQYGLDPSLVHAVVAQESNFSPTAVSSAGAIGLMQLMPQTAASLGVNPYSPEDNLRGGIKYLSSLMNQYHGNVPMALAAYNAGPSAVQTYGGIPPYPETQHYVANIMSQLP